MAHNYIFTIIRRSGMASTIASKKIKIKGIVSVMGKHNLIFILFIFGVETKDKPA